MIPLNVSASSRRAVVAEPQPKLSAGLYHQSSDSYSTFLNTEDTECSECFFRVLMRCLKALHRAIRNEMAQLFVQNRAIRSEMAQLSVQRL